MTSPREKPRTRRLASSRPRSDNATRAPLYTMPAAMMHANATIIVIEIEKLCAMVSSNPRTTDFPDHHAAHRRRLA